MLDDNRARYVHAYLKGYVNEQARIPKVHIYSGCCEYDIDISTKRIITQKDPRVQQQVFNGTRPEYSRVWIPYSHGILYTSRV